METPTVIWVHPSGRRRLVHIGAELLWQVADNCECGHSQVWRRFSPTESFVKEFVAAVQDTARQAAANVF